jgi:hypothetical protein
LDEGFGAVRGDGLSAVFDDALAAALDDASVAALDDALAVAPDDASGVVLDDVLGDRLGVVLDDFDSAAGVLPLPEDLVRRDSSCAGAGLGVLAAARLLIADRSQVATTSARCT